MSLVEHAQRELELLGEDPAYSASLVAAIAVFASFGHSGGSAMCAREQMTKLLAYEELTPITDNPEEWEDRSGPSGYPLWQSVRNPKLFSEDEGKTYWDVDSGGAAAPRQASLPHRSRCRLPEKHTAHAWDGLQGNTSARICWCNGAPREKN